MIPPQSRMAAATETRLLRIQFFFMELKVHFGFISMDNLLVFQKIVAYLQSSIFPMH